MMWAAAAPYPYYSEYHSSRRKRSTGKKDKKDGTSDSAATPASGTGLDTDMAAGLLEPAIDGPPSPERLRALNKQMKQAANFDKHRSHHPSASTSSIHNSADRPWDQVLDNITLSRRSSGRSTSSSMPSRERPDSVQLFGKAIFSRKGARLKRDSSTNSSSASSLYSGETPLENAQASAKDHLIHGIFTRRRAAKSDPHRDASSTPATVKKHSISGPYSFQHVAHTPREHVPALERANRMGSVTDFPTLNPNDSRFPDLPPESNVVTESSHGSGGTIDVEESHTRANLDRPRVYTTTMMPRTGKRRLVKSSKSQDQMRVPPPRPPRPPKSAILETEELSLMASPPVPPPRLSSRQSIRYGAFDPLATTTLSRPQTSGGFRQPEPFCFASESSPPPTAHGRNPSADFGLSTPDSYHHAMTTPDDEAWPLTPTTTATTTTTQDGALPDVPEEVEPPKVSHKSRGSVRSVLSTSSSVRRSQSVPQLRPSTQQADLSEASHRPTSAGSDTLGRFDLFAAQRALKGSAQDSDEMEPPCRSSWEDDIDYCYEHELEAVCDYEWTRRSSETCRDGADATSYLSPSESRSSATQAEAPEPTSKLLLTPQDEDVPALSPASQVSANDPEATTPTTTTTTPTAPPTAPSFSSRRPGAAGLALQKTRPVSTASSFKESHGFTLSPSLLIPGDYQQQMTLATSDAGYDGSGPVIVDDYRLTATSHSSVVDRVSTSTLGTDSSGPSASSSAGRHESTSTAFTRFTGDSEEGSWSPKSEAVNPRNECSFVETLIPGPPPELDAGLAVPDFGAGIPGVGRPRAKTTSLATPQPRSPYSSFPRSPSMRRL
ncbi:hypothetical protein VUR80DRAFT_7501 [Thermomyces stellatus]